MQQSSNYGSCPILVINTETRFKAEGRRRKKKEEEVESVNQKVFPKERSPNIL
ncbi:MAG: hypothetical protein ACREPR_02755 [Brasilonema sp.]